MAEEYRELVVGPGERRQIEEGLSAAFGLSPAGAAGWVDTTLEHGVYFGARDGDVVAGSFAGEALDFARGDRRRTLALLQSHFIRPEYRGRGWGVSPQTLEELRLRFAADGVVICLYDEPLRRYWGRLGFEIEHEATVMRLDEHVARSQESLSPVVTPDFVDEKVYETEAAGGLVERFGGMLALTHPGDDAITELLVLDRAAAREWAASRSSRPVRLRTVMTWPRRLDLFCPFDV
jgi:hypothetical protein